ncbi:unnamed protein product [Polarella glacialis]|uniref:Uncharacterized protein n=1 Tax=Polarella glacialis TaxID=89957 RepID=A0A813M924_POLGL|nr:unnamed protein product [Polarella glacialis]
MAAVKLIKFVAVAILASSSAAEPTNRTCAGQDQDEVVALQVGEQSHAGACHCGKVCPGYEYCSGGENLGNGKCNFDCSDAKESYLASKPPGVDQEAISQSWCSWYYSDGSPVGGFRCWSAHGSALIVSFNLDEASRPVCPAGFECRFPSATSLACSYCSLKHMTSMNVVCPHGWCACRVGGCGCKAEGSCK